MAAGTTVDELIVALRDKSAEIRQSATETLRELEDARAVEPVTAKRLGFEHTRNCAPRPTTTRTPHVAFSSASPQTLNKPHTPSRQHASEALRLCRS
ncbi:MAG: hypothetical protein WB946_04620 [Halobacteriota archaeon]|jgi:hypothetical protein